MWNNNAFLDSGITVALGEMLKANIKVFNFKSLSCCLLSGGISPAQLGPPGK